jgi:serine/threonine protein kinase
MKVLPKAVVAQRNQVEHTQAERAILESVVHPYIIRLKYAFQTATKLFLVLPYLKGGEVFFHLRAMKQFPENLARFYVAELALALGHLHAVGIVYRDIKPENILLDSDGHVKLTDFGLAKVLSSPSDCTNTFCGTPEYLAPEMIEGRPYDKGVDWWGLGVLLWEFLTGLPPFYAQNVQRMYDLIRMQQLVFPPHFSKDARSLLSRLLERDPNKRLGNAPGEDLEAIQSHPFFSGIDWDALAFREVEPPWKPSNLTDTNGEDVSNFDLEFTTEAVHVDADSRSGTPQMLASIASGHSPQLPRFDGFSYYAGSCGPSREASRMGSPAEIP